MYLGIARTRQLSTSPAYTGLSSSQSSVGTCDGTLERSSTDDPFKLALPLFRLLRILTLSVLEEGQIP